MARSPIWVKALQNSQPLLNGLLLSDDVGDFPETVGQGAPKRPKLALADPSFQGFDAANAAANASQLALIAANTSLSAFDPSKQPPGGSKKPAPAPPPSASDLALQTYLAMPENTGLAIFENLLTQIGTNIRTPSLH